MVRVRDGYAHVIEAGSGDPVVLLGGDGCVAATWAPLLADLEGSHHVFAADRPGCGLSDPLTTAGASFREFNCTACHDHNQVLTDQLHKGVATYSYTAMSCFGCHADGSRQAFDHAGIAAACADCHAVGAPFAALPFTPAGGGTFTHPNMNGSDCAACHSRTIWKADAAPPGPVSDPAQSVLVNALVPTYAAMSIASLTPQAETLAMPMNHASTALPSAVMSGCANCHVGTATGSYYPGKLHASLANLGARRIRRAYRDEPRAGSPLGRDEARRGRVGQRRAHHHAGHSRRVRPLSRCAASERWSLVHFEIGRHHGRVPRRALGGCPAPAWLVHRLPRQHAPLRNPDGCGSGAPERGEVRSRRERRAGRLRLLPHEQQ